MKYKQGKIESFGRIFSSGLSEVVDPHGINLTENDVKLPKESYNKTRLKEMIKRKHFDDIEGIL